MNDLFWIGGERFSNFTASGLFGGILPAMMICSTVGNSRGLLFTAFFKRAVLLRDYNNAGCEPPLAVTVGNGYSLPGCRATAECMPTSSTEDR